MAVIALLREARAAVVPRNWGVDVERLPRRSFQRRRVRR
jgi:hypothetical protein